MLYKKYTFTHDVHNRSFRWREFQQRLLNLTVDKKTRRLTGEHVSLSSMSRFSLRILNRFISIIFQVSIPLWVRLGTFRNAIVSSSIVHCNPNEGVIKDNQISQHPLHKMQNAIPSDIYGIDLMKLRDKMDKIQGQQSLSDYTTSNIDH